MHISVTQVTHKLKILSNKELNDIITNTCILLANNPAKRFLEKIIYNEQNDYVLIKNRLKL